MNLSPVQPSRLQSSLRGVFSKIGEFREGFWEKEWEGEKEGTGLARKKSNHTVFIRKALGEIKFEKKIVRRKRDGMKK